MIEFLQLREANITFRFGFSDQQNLIRYFKKQLGFAPKTHKKGRGLSL